MGAPSQGEEIQMARTIAVLIGRLIFGCVFLMATYFKFTGMEATAGYIASIGFPLPMVFAWLAALFELALVVAFFTGILFSQAAALAALYVIFLAFAFHGPGTWGANPMEFGFFTDHFSFFAGLLFAAAHGPGDKLVIKWPR
jgi:putative oxidoreductase